MKNRSCLLLSCLFLLVSCGEKKTEASVFIYNENDTFIRSLNHALQAELDGKGYSYSVKYASNSQIQQNESIVDARDSGNSKRRFINLVDRLSSGAIIDKVSKKDIPVIFFNRQPLDSDRIRGRKTNKNIFFVGTDPLFEGSSQAKRVETLFKTEDGLFSEYDKNHDGVIQLALLKGEIGNQDTEKRSNSALNTLKTDGYQTEILASSYCNWSRDEAKVVRKDWYEQFGDKIELVLSNNDDRAIGAVDYLIENDLVSDNPSDSLPFPVFGVDGTDIGIQYRQKGLLSGTVKNEEKKQAKTCVEIADCLLNNKELPDDFTETRANEYTVYVQGEILSNL